MALPVGVTQLGTLKGTKGDKGDPGTFAAASAVTVAADQPARAVLGGTPAARTVTFYVPRGLPGAGGATSDAATATLIATPDSQSRRELNARFVGVLDRAKVVCLGDSLTEGNQDGTGTTYPGVLQQLLPDATVTNLGRSGWASADVAARWGVPFVLAGFTVPAGITRVPVTIVSPVGGFRESAPIFPSWMGELTLPDGTIIPGRLRHTIDPGATVVNGWTFERTTAGSSVAVDAGAVFRSTEFDHLKDAFLVINVGRNNVLTQPHLVVRDVSAILTEHRAPAESVIVLPVPASTNESAAEAARTRVTAVNARLRDAFPKNYLDDYEYMRWKGNAVNGIATPLADVQNVEYGLVPLSQLFDAVHPNAAGYRAKADAIRNRIVEIGAYGRSVAVPGVTAKNGPLVWRAGTTRVPAPGTTKALADSFYSRELVVHSSVAADPAVHDDTSRYLAFRKNTFMSAPVTSILDPYLVVAKLRLTDLAAQGHGIVWSEGPPGDTFFIDSAGRLAIQSNFGNSAVVIPEDQWVWVYAIFDSVCTVWAEGIGSSTVPLASLGMKTAVRVGYTFAGSAKYADFDLDTLAVIPGQFNPTTAQAMVSLLKNRFV